MSHVLIRVITRFAPVFTLPVAVVIGFIGYNIESYVSNRSTPSLETSIWEEREKRLLNQADANEPELSIFEKNDRHKLRK